MLLEGAQLKPLRDDVESQLGSLHLQRHAESGQLIHSERGDIVILDPQEFCSTGNGRLVRSYPSLVAGVGFKATEVHNWVRYMRFSSATDTGSRAKS
jgi:hypothetical protein